MPTTEIANDAVRAVFAAYDPHVRHELMAVRNLIFAAADCQREPVELIETLKWGQISYLPKRTRVGTTVRIGASDATDHVASVYFHCQTRLLDTFRERYPDTLTFVDNREIALGPNWAKYASELEHCLALALTYHRWK